MQRPSNLFLLLLLLLPGLLTVGNARAEMISGTVRSVDPAAGSFILATPEGREILVRVSTPLPRRIESGRQVRVWGDYTDGSTFSATDLRGMGRHHGQDPTGVRARLHKGRQCRYGAGGSADTTGSPQ
jgi:hypothetical protein